MRRLLSALIALSPTAWTAHADASTRGLELTWDAPAECPRAADVERALAESLGDRDRADAVVVHGSAKRVGDSVRVELDTVRGDSRGRRTLLAENCRLATDAAIVSLALMLDDGPPAAAPVAVAPVPDHVQSVATPPRARRAFVTGVVDGAALPGVAPGLLAGVAWETPRIRAHVAAGALLPARTEGRTTIDGRTLGIEARLWFASARGEMHVVRGPMTFALATGLDVGVLHARGTGAWVPSSTDVLWIGAALGPALRVAVHDRLILGAEVEAVASLLRPELRVDVETLFRPAPLGMRLGASAELAF